MCLDTIDKTITVESGTGYKRFGRDDYNHLRAEFRSTRFPIGKWLEDKKKKPISGPAGMQYPTGFHIYLARPGPLTGITRKVLFDNVVAQGKQDGKRVVVAKRIFVEPLGRRAEEDKQCQI